MTINKGELVAYLSYLTLKNNVQTLAESTVPTRLDHHVLQGLSGATRSALLSGLRFLGLLGDEGVVKQEYRELVDAFKEGEESYRDALLKILDRAYKPIVGQVDIERGTLPELEKAFRDAGVPAGQMLMKSIRFYLKALSDCGVTVSPHITKARPRTASGKKNGGAKSKAKTKSKTPPPPATGTETPTGIPTGFERLPIPGVPEAYIQYPADVNETTCTLFESMIAVLRTYAKVRQDGKEG